MSSLPKGYRKWRKTLKQTTPGHYTMEYDSAFGFSGSQIILFIKHMKEKHDDYSILIGPEFLYGIMDRFLLEQ